jgi:ABC-2 type transport system ATP-binding protein
MIEISHLTRKYGDRTAVNDLTLDVRRGEIMAFLGPNGAGKTTTIKTIVGLLLPSSGRIAVCGVDVVQSPREASHKIGYVPDQPYLYEKLSGREFLLFTAEMYGLHRVQAEENVNSAIDAFELAPFVDRLAEGYSHGMKQRVIFAAAMVHDPQVLVVDEPMVGLDPKSMRFVKNHLRNEASAGTSVFLSTHTLSVAEEIADRIGIIDQGNLRFLGSMEELRERMQQKDSNLENLFLTLTADVSESPMRVAH